MRFPQVPIGQRFSFQGKHYTKTGPLTASEEGAGEQRMIPRAAEVALIDTAGEPAKTPGQRDKRAEMSALLTRFKSDLIVNLRELAAEDGSLQLDQVVALIEVWKPDD